MSRRPRVPPPTLALRLLLGGLLLALAGCGFRLAGVSSWPQQEFPGYAIDSQLEGIDGEDFEETLRLALEAIGLEEELRPAAQLELVALDARKIISALDATGQAVEFELQQRLRFRLLAMGERSPLLAVVAQRRLSFDPAIALAKQEEEAQIELALRAELAELMLLRVEAELRSLMAAPTTPR